MSQEVQSLLFGALSGVLASTAFLLAVFIGFCVLFGFSKFRESGKKSRVVKSLDQMVGLKATYLPPDAPRGPADQLKSPELLEAASRQA